MKILSVGSKTFLSGEYLAVTGGPALVVTTEPSFKLYVFSDPKNIKNQTENISVSIRPLSQAGFHPESPVGILLKKELPTLLLTMQNQIHVGFWDPFQQDEQWKNKNILGGFGASSAEYFLIKYLLNELKTNANWIENKNIELNLEDRLKSEWLEWVKEYNQISGASGADLTAHYLGNISFFWKNKNIFKNISFQFKNIEILIFSTGIKLKTHDHLKQINKTLKTDTQLTTTKKNSDLLKSYNLKSYSEDMVQKTEPYQSIVLSMLSAIENSDEKLFIQSVQQSYCFLKSNGWLALSTENYLNQIKALDLNHQILASKGCGAMGADTILVVTNSSAESLQSLISAIQSLGLIFVASSKNISKGFQIC